MHIFWVAGLLLAFIDIPDFGGFLGRIAGSVERMAGLKPGTGGDEVAEPGAMASPRAVEAASEQHGGVGEASAAKKSMRPVTGRKDLDHA